MPARAPFPLVDRRWCWLRADGPGPLRCAALHSLPFHATDDVSARCPLVLAGLSMEQSLPWLLLSIAATACCRQHSPAFARRIGDEVPPRQFASSPCLAAHLACAHPPIPQPAVGALSLALSQPSLAACPLPAYSEWP